MPLKIAATPKVQIGLASRHPTFVSVVQVVLVVFCLCGDGFKPIFVDKLFLFENGQDLIVVVLLGALLLRNYRCFVCILVVIHHGSSRVEKLVLVLILSVGVLME